MAQLITVLSMAQSCYPHIQPINNTAGLTSTLQMTKMGTVEKLVACTGMKGTEA